MRSKPIDDLSAVEQAKLSAGLGLSGFFLALAVQLVVAPASLHDRVYDLFNTAAVVAVLAYAALHMTQDRRGRIWASLTLAALPLLVVFREYEGIKSWQSFIASLLLIAYFEGVLLSLWVDAFPTLNRRIDRALHVDSTSTRFSIVFSLVSTTMYTPAVVSVAPLDMVTRLAITGLLTLSVLGVVGTLALRGKARTVANHGM